MPITINAGHESCPECGERLSVVCTKNFLNVKYKSFECIACGNTLSISYDTDSAEVTRKKIERDKTLERMERWIAENQPVTRAEIMKNFGLNGSSFRSKIFVLTYQCPLWQSDKKPSKYGIDYSINKGIDGLISGHVSRMSSYGHTSTLEEL